MDRSKPQGLRREERAVYDLRELYRKYGYVHYRMNQFEEYELYARNKDFLVGERMITFTDADGTLLALKPDVTLSIIKNSAGLHSGARKVYYQESVYRAAKGEGHLREMTQMGVECIGAVDFYQVCEVITLAAQSLSCIADGTVLALSDLELMRDIADACGVSEDDRARVLDCVKDKNASALTALCREHGWDEQVLGVLIGCYGQLGQVLSELEARLPEAAKARLETLRTLDAALDQAGCGQQVQLDFSVANDMNYYNGLVFQGYVPGVPVSVLSGGQYDSLVEKMGLDGRAIGFAVYMDALESLDRDAVRKDADVLLLYGPSDDAALVLQAAAALRENGERVLVARGDAGSSARVGRTVVFQGGGKGN